MKIAICHDSLSEFGGAERVLTSLVHCYPMADVFSLHAKREVALKTIGRGTQLHTSRAGNLLREHISLSQLLAPIIWKNINLSQYDLIITSSCYGLSSLAVRENKPVLHYVHSLPKNLFGLESPTRLQKIFPYQAILRSPYRSSLKKGLVVCNSHHIEKQLRQFIDVDPIVVHPPVVIPKKILTKKRQNFYVTITRIDETKSLELMIEAFNKNGLLLKIVGGDINSRYGKKLQRLAHENIRFLGFQSESKINSLLSQAKAFIFTAKNEDFGIAPVEAMAHGLPVIAYAGGGLRETVRHRKTGLFFRKHTPQALQRAITLFNSVSFDSTTIYAQARSFSQEVFEKKISRLVDQIISQQELFA